MERLIHAVQMIGVGRARHKLLTRALITALSPSVICASSLVAAGTEPIHDSPRTDCVLIDNDYDIDDMMAIPLVIGNRHVAAIVQTEGYSLPGPAAAALDALLHGASQPAPQQPMKILVGGSQVHGPGQIGPGLPFVREMMRRSNGLLTSAPAPWESQPAYPELVRQALSGCRDVSVLLTGPFTSFIHYLPLIRDRVKQVVFTGKIIGQDGRVSAKGSFNCSYDLSACRTAVQMLSDLNSLSVVVPDLAGCGPSLNPPPHCYVPNQAMVIGQTGPDGRTTGGLLAVGLPGRLRRALVNDTPCPPPYDDRRSREHPCISLSTWLAPAVFRETHTHLLLWDLVTALALIDVNQFALQRDPGDAAFDIQELQPKLVNGSHQQTVEALRRLWTTKTNNAALLPPHSLQ
jgi:hypothetical protein